MRLRRLIALAVLAAVLAVPVAPLGAATRASARSGADRITAAEKRWLLVVDQLAANVVDAGRTGSFTGGSIDRAGALIADPMVLFESVLAFSIYASCTDTLSAAGRPSNRLRTIHDAVAAACRRLVPAAERFGTATRRRQPAGLVAADKQAIAGVVLMQKAAARLSAFHKANK